MSRDHPRPLLRDRRNGSVKVEVPVQYKNHRLTQTTPSTASTPYRAHIKHDKQGDEIKSTHPWTDTTVACEDTPTSGHYKRADRHRLPVKHGYRANTESIIFVVIARVSLPHNIRIVLVAMQARDSYTLTHTSLCSHDNGIRQLTCERPRFAV